MSPSGRTTTTILDLRAAKQRGERFIMLTAYDFPTARVLDAAGVPVILVGDSLGNAVLGYESTLPVTVDDMVRHTAAVSRGANAALVVADLPFMSYQASIEQGMGTSARLLQEGGADAVKLEGGAPMVPLVTRLVQAGIPVMGHLGLTPQSIHQLGGHRVQGREQAQAEQILLDAQQLEEAGAFSIVLECVPASLAQAVTERLSIPTIGIGAGPSTDAQVLVVNDLIGLGEGPRPRFVKQYADVAATISGAAQAFQKDVATGAYPAPEHTY